VMCTSQYSTGAAIMRLPDDHRIGHRADFGYLRDGQDDQHGEDDRGGVRKHWANLKVAERLQVGAEEQDQHLSGGAWGGTDDLHSLIPLRVIVFNAGALRAAQPAPQDCARDAPWDDFPGQLTPQRPRIAPVALDTSYAFCAGFRDKGQPTHENINGPTGQRPITGESLLRVTKYTQGNPTRAPCSLRVYCPASMPRWARYRYCG
jgi:hypothetical protein